eukprot:Hpha_TRINITY_DN27228_c0_g1::TRINITY_DN27228_c0_g1_i1::g.140708::m.140708/K07407/E3.2.1.22B, galA, rafA; alpha-galactosidase
MWRVVIVACGAALAAAIDNGLGITPPRGWRSWNQFDCSINQSLIESQYRAIVSKKRMVDGVPTSLLDLGYRTAGIDDCWQQKNSGPGGVGFHNASGYPIVNTDKFPNMRGMADYAKSLGVTPGWYGNNCAWKETRPACNETDLCFQGDVQATIDFGFESLKLDGCGIENNMTKFAELFNATGKPVLLENCHNGNPKYPYRGTDGKAQCPMNFFRSSQDIRNEFGSILQNLNTTRQYNGGGLTGPGCWAYPDMLEVGVTAPDMYGNILNFTEARTHFAAWCVVSAPLVLGNDLTNDTMMDIVWPIISNKEALAVNEAWAGDAGVRVAASKELIPVFRVADQAAWMVWAKRLARDGSRQAVLLMNNKPVAFSVSVDFSRDLNMTCPLQGCSVRDIYLHKDLGTFTNSFTATDLGTHDSSFIVVQA